MGWEAKIVKGFDIPLDDLPDLTDLNISPRRAELVFLPFEDHAHDYVHPGIQAGINKQMLAMSSNL
ncbi:MAG: hypothetical protein ABR534_12335 [Desulfotignum sp.]|nr:hypothetical protein [Desulfobacteraceae bacterium]